MTTEPTPPPNYDPPDYGNGDEAEQAAFQAALNKAPREETATGYRWRAPCPRCTTEVVVEVSKIHGLDVAYPRAMCSCAHNHSGRPEGTVSGCGFDVTVPWTGDEQR